MNTEDSEFERIEREQAIRGVPDAIHHTDTSETLEYIKGWNDCRQAMLEQPDHQDMIGEAQDMLIAEQAAQAQPAPVQEPVGCEWTPCMKLPVVVHVRKQRLGEAHVSTREGITPVHPDDLIMRGVSGEEYPISRTIFEQTYTLDTTPQAQPAREPLTNLEGLKLAYNHHWLNNRAGVDAYLLGIRDAEAAHGIKDNQS